MFGRTNTAATLDDGVLWANTSITIFLLTFNLKCGGVLVMIHGGGFVGEFHVFGRWLNLGAMAVQCVREAVEALGFARAAKFPPSEIVPGEMIPTRNHPPMKSSHLWGHRFK